MASVIQESTGNTLAYALSAMQSILELDYGYKNLDVTFVKKVRLSQASWMSANTDRCTPVPNRSSASLFRKPWLTLSDQPLLFYEG